MRSEATRVGAIVVAALLCASCGEPPPVAPAVVVAPAIDPAGLDPLVLDRITEARAAVLAAPDDGSAWGAFGRLLVAYEYHDDARIALQRAAELAPHDPGHHYHLGVLLAERGDLAAAERFEQVLAIRPGDWPARLRHAQALRARGDGIAAAAALETLLQQPEAEPWARLALGRGALEDGDPGAALEHLERARALAPHSREAAYQLAVAYRLLGRQREGEAVLASLAFEAGEPEGFPDPWQAEIERERVSAASLVEAADRLLRANREREAQSLLERVLVGAPEDTDALFKLGMLYGRSRRFAEAQSLLERLVALRPDFADGWVGLALVHESLGRPDLADLALDRALAIDPSHPRASALRE